MKTTDAKTGEKRDTIFESFLAEQCQPGLALAADSDILDLIPLGAGVPRQYLASYRARTFAQARSGEIALVDRFDVTITFHDEYLRRPNPARVLTYEGPYRCYHPNIRGCAICLELHPGLGLTDLLIATYELFTWRLYYVGDNGLNPAASAWARRQDPGSFPTDPRPLRRNDRQEH